MESTRRSLVHCFCVTRISRVMPAASWFPVVGSVRGAARDLESLGSATVQGAGPEAGKLHVVSAVGPVTTSRTSPFRVPLGYVGRDRPSTGRREQRFGVAARRWLFRGTVVVSRLGSDAWFAQDD